jgi:asparagine synthase (glutamine-hydrolysing)
VPLLNGVFFADMRPTLEHAATIRAGLESMAADETDVTCEPGIAIGTGAFETWLGSAPGPVRSPSGKLIAFDGRLDNRGDLDLQLRGRFSRETDAAVALGVFERWGIDGLGRLAGEWSAAIWDATQRTLHLARDGFGVRPLFYSVGCAAGAPLVLWSTNLGELVHRSGCRDAIGEEFVASLIVGTFSPEVTPYRGVRAVPPGTCISFSPGRLERRQRFWTLGASLVRLARPRDYAEMYRSLWSDAVRVRLRTTQAVWAELSGGLDSSSVVCMADALVRAGRAEAPRLRLISHATLDSPEGDERRFIAEVEGRVGVRSDVLGVEEHQTLVDDEWDWVSPFAARGVQLACLRHVRRHGGRVIMSGRIGDVVGGCQPDNSLAVFDDLSQHGMFAALAGIRQWCRATREPFVHTSLRLLGWIASPPREASVRARLDRAVLLSPRLRIAACGHDPVDSLDGIRPAKRHLARLLLGYTSTSRLDLPLLPPGIVYTHPFSHRPLVEFMLAVPGHVVASPGETRSLMRRSLAEIVPPAVLNRESKGYYPPAALRGSRLAASRLPPVDRLECVRRGWLDPGPLERALRSLIDTGTARAELRRAIRLEEWLTSRQRRGPAATPTRKEVRTNGVHHA